MSEGTGQIDNPSISAKFRADVIIPEIQQKVDFATTADKILGILQDDPIVVTLAPGATMEFYPPTDEQFIDLLSLQGDGAQIASRIKKLGLASGTTDEEAETIMPQAMGIINQAKDMLMSINEMLAVLSVDKAWTAEKFKQLPKKYKAVIMAAISSTQEREIAKVKKFRGKQLGNRS